MHGAQAQDAMGPEDVRCRKLAGPVGWHLVPTTEELAYRMVDVVVDGTVGHQAGPVAEVGTSHAASRRAGREPRATGRDCLEPEARRFWS